MQENADKIMLYSRWKEWSGIILLTLLIPNLAGMIDHRIEPWHLLLSYLHFFVLAWLIWKVTQIWRISYMEKWAGQALSRSKFVALSLLITLPIAFIVIFLWYQYPGADFVDWIQLSMALGISLICVAVIAYAQLANILAQQKVTPVQENARQIDRILVLKGKANIPLPLQEIAFFATKQQVVFAYSTNQLSYRTTYTLKELETRLPAVTFFRANRQYLIHIDAVESFHSDPDGKITAVLRHSDPVKISISRERGAAFKKWLLGEG